jgi:hypothetical protein
LTVTSDCPLKDLSPIVILCPTLVAVPAKLVAVIVSLLGFTVIAVS